MAEFDLLEEFKQEYIREEIPLEEFERKAAMYLRACGDDLMDPDPQGLDLIEIDAERERLLPRWQFTQPIREAYIFRHKVLIHDT